MHAYPGYWSRLRNLHRCRVVIGTSSQSVARFHRNWWHGPWIGRGIKTDKFNKNRTKIENKHRRRVVIGTSSQSVARFHGNNDTVDSEKLLNLAHYRKLSFAKSSFARLLTAQVFKVCFRSLLLSFCSELLLPLFSAVIRCSPTVRSCCCCCFLPSLLFEAALRLLLLDGVVVWLFAAGLWLLMLLLLNL